jgi:hypothetical protein
VPRTLSLCLWLAFSRISWPGGFMSYSGSAVSCLFEFTREHCQQSSIWLARTRRNRQGEIGRRCGCGNTDSAHRGLERVLTHFRSVICTESPRLKWPARD